MGAEARGRTDAGNADEKQGATGKMGAVTTDQAAFRDELVARGLFLETGVPGLYGHGAAFEHIRLRFDQLVTTAAGEDHPELLRFPPLMPRRQLESSGYLHSFPHLAGTVFAFDGTESDALEQQRRASQHEDWAEFQSMTALSLVPAACYPVYPAIAARGALPAAGVVIDAGAAWVFRHEPSADPARLQAFHQREMVKLGPPDEVRAWRDGWCARGLALLRGLGLAAERDRAVDAFFGRGGRMLAASQREQELKFELQVPLGGAAPTAVTSFNYHQDHFAERYGLVLADGSTAHTACLGFGEERIVLALLYTHGLDPTAWPAEVRRVLWDS